jgi:hypothetical protein
MTMQKKALSSGFWFTLTVSAMLRVSLFRSSSYCNGMSYQFLHGRDEYLLKCVQFQNIRI